METSLTLLSLRYWVSDLICKNFRVSFELEPGTVGNTTDFKEANRRLEWGLKKVGNSSFSVLIIYVHGYICAIVLSKLYSRFSMGFFRFSDLVIEALCCRLLVDLNIHYVQNWHFHKNHMVIKCLFSFLVCYVLFFCCCVIKVCFYLPLFRNVGNIVKEAGPVSMTFIIPMYNASRLQVSNLVKFVDRGLRIKLISGSRLYKKDFELQCAHWIINLHAGEVSADSEEIKDWQSISMGAICHTS